MSPKPKPEEDPVWLNFTIEPTEKARWKVYAMIRGIPLATFIKMEINKIVDAEFEASLKSLLDFNKDILGVMIFQDNLQLLHRQGEIESENGMRMISQIWRKFNRPLWSCRYLQEKMLIIQMLDDRLVLKSKPDGANGGLTIIGYRMENNYKFLARVKANGNSIVALADLQRVAYKMFPPQPRLVEKGMLEKILPEFYQGKSQLQAIDLLRRIPLVPQEQTALKELEQFIGKPIPAIPPFQDGDITRSNPQFDSVPLIYFAI
nr:hypothetical protein [Candidatus Sigynarchaeota archaeon]